MKQTEPFIITINRQLGSGGAFVGQELAKRLGIFYADREIVTRAAKDLSMLVEDVESYDEKVSSFWQSFLKMYSFGTPDGYMPPQINIPTDRELFDAESEIIKRIAKEGSAVVIGRCGCYVLRDHPHLIRVYLHSDPGFRKFRIQQMKNVTTEAAAKMMQQSDKERALYFQTFTGKEWADARMYDLAINTSKIGLEKTVDLIVKYIEQL